MALSSEPTLALNLRRQEASMYPPLFWILPSHPSQLPTIGHC